MSCRVGAGRPSVPDLPEAPSVALAPVVTREVTREVTVVREFLSFILSSERYAVPLMGVREILMLPKLTKVPRSDPAVVGICSVRGMLVTVFDLSLCLGLEACRPTRKARVLLAWLGDEVIGFLVDEVRQVLRFAQPDIEPPESAFGSVAGHPWLGMGQAADGTVLLIDLESLEVEG